MRSKSTAGWAALAGVVAAAHGATPAEAKIKCSADGFQYVQGNLISTPYCQDNLVAQVARKYGVRVTEAEIRNNPNKKREVCRFVGRDIRIRDACATVESGGRRGGY